MYVLSKTWQVWGSRSVTASICFQRPEKRSRSTPGQKAFPLAFLFYSGLQLIGWGPPTSGRAICFLSALSFILISCRHALTDTPRIMFDQRSGNPMVLSGWHIKLTITTPICYPNFCGCKGVWQGCILSSCLFNLHAECTMWTIVLDES